MAGKLLMVMAMALLGGLSSLGELGLGQQVVAEKDEAKPDPCTPPTGSSETICNQYCAAKDDGVFASGCCMTEKDESDHSSPYNFHVSRNASDDDEAGGFEEGGVSAITFCNCCERGYKCETGGSGCECDDAACAKYCSDANGWDGCCSKDKKTCQCCNSDDYQICDKDGYPGREPSHTCMRVCTAEDCQPSCQSCAEDLLANPKCDKFQCNEGETCDGSGGCVQGQGRGKLLPAFWRSEGM